MIPGKYFNEYLFSLAVPQGLKEELFAYASNFPNGRAIQHNRLHLTLFNLHEKDTQGLAEAMRKVATQPVPTVLGKAEVRKNSLVLGLEDDHEVLAFRDRILQEIGAMASHYNPERRQKLLHDLEKSRPAPHITLARFYELDLPKDVLDQPFQGRTCIFKDAYLETDFRGKNRFTYQLAR